MNNVAILLMTLGKFGLMKLAHITYGWLFFQSFVIYRAVEAMAAVTIPALLSVGIKII